MRNVLTISILLGLLFALGCGEIKVNVAGIPGLKKSEPEKEPGEPARGPTRKEEFQGHYLTVFIDGEQTKMGEMVGSQQRWIVDSCGGNPTVKFEMDARHLGEFKQVELTINPMKGNSPDHNTLYQNDRSKQMKPAREMKLDKFDCMGGGKYEQVSAIPPGKYYFNLKVNGQKTWDAQKIVVEVK